MKRRDKYVVKLMNRLFQLLASKEYNKKLRLIIQTGLIAGKSQTEYDNEGQLVLYTGIYKKEKAQ